MAETPGDTAEIVRREIACTRHGTSEVTGAGRCKVCRSEENARFRAKHPARYKAAIDASRAKRPVHHAAALRAAVARWKKEHPGKHAAHEGKRRAAKMKRTPAWADQEWIIHAYEVAADMTAKMGDEYHVDHEVPLQGERVSGLHVYENLQIISGTDNCRKNNRFQV